ncbi:MAG: VPDSG-CTERM sorting domain-containing protein [Verrucomicrobiota bacterium]
MKNILQLVGTACLFGLIQNQQAHANVIDFGTSWPAITATGQITDDPYAASASPYNLVLAAAKGAGYSTKTQIANLLNLVTTTTFSSSDILKTDNPPELGGSDGYFMITSGWKYLVVQYDGPNGGSVVIELDGSGAKVPYDSALIWGTGDKYAVSHYAVAGVASNGNPQPVPDGGTTAAMLGLSLLGLRFALRRKV